jgi:hypothetical protein
MTDEVKIVFTSEPTARQGGDFKVGKVYKMSPASAERWIRRGIAITEADAKAAKAESKTEAKVETE